ncbi:MAG TPA: hypothetical protein VFH68_12820 [Polyangia bacterium]|jgi:hypothetical protein|nr:hypothetical protein [Polyangia bacterium]
MIPYAELERALARWKARSHSAAVEIGGHDIVHSTAAADGSQPTSLTNGTTGEIDANELVESYED